MQALFSASLVTFVVVAGIATVGWLRNRSTVLKDDGNKKKDEELTGDEIEVVVEAGKQHVSPSRSASQAVADMLNGKLPTNRRPFLRTGSDRFVDPRSASESENNEPVDVTQVRSILPPPNRHTLGSIQAGLRTAIKPNNLSSFVRQCVSNIERAQLSASNFATRALLNPDEDDSNQCDSPPKRTGSEHQVPSLVTATDCTSKSEEPVEEEVAEGRQKRVLARKASNNESTMPEVRAVKGLASFTAAKPSSPPVQAASLIRPPAITRKPSVPEHIDPAKKTAEREQPVPQTPAPSAHVRPPQIARKSSATAAKLLQFQQLVPSNQARSSFVDT